MQEPQPPQSNIAVSTQNSSQKPAPPKNGSSAPQQKSSIAQTHCMMAWSQQPAELDSVQHELVGVFVLLEQLIWHCAVPSHQVTFDPLQQPANPIPVGHRPT